MDWTSFVSPWMRRANPLTLESGRPEVFPECGITLRCSYESRRECRRSRPIVSAWMVGTQENVRDLPDMILLASRLGIDEVYLQRLVYPLDGPGHGLAGRDASIAGSSEEIDEIIARSISLSRRLGVRLKPPA